MKFVNYSFIGAMLSKSEDEMIFTILKKLYDDSGSLTGYEIGDEIVYGNLTKDRAYKLTLLNKEEMMIQKYAEYLI
jgi:hypothetical protein